VADEPESIVLVYLRRIDANVAEVRRVQAEHGQRIAALEIAQGTILRHLGSLVEADARLQVGLDHLSDRVGRIERRLDLADPIPAA